LIPKLKVAGSILVLLVPHVPIELLRDFEALDQSDSESDVSFLTKYSGGVGWSGETPAEAKALPLLLAKLPRIEKDDQREVVRHVLRALDLYAVDVSPTVEAVSPWMILPEFRLLLEKIRAWDDPNRRAEALKAMAPRLPASLVPQAFEIATSILDRSAVSEALHELATTLAEDGLWKESMAAAEAIADAFLRTEALILAARAAPDSARADILHSASMASHEVPPGVYRYRGENQNVECRSVAIALVAPLFDEPQRRQLFQEAIDTDRDVESNMRELAAPLLSYFLAQAGYADWSIETAQSIDGDYARSSALVGIAPFLDEAGRERALSEIAARSHPADLARMLAWISPQLSPALAEKALRIAAELKQPEDRLLVWTALVPRVSPERRAAGIAATLDLAKTECSPACQVRTIAALLAHVPPEHTEDLIGSALQSCREMEDDKHRVDAFSELLRNLPKQHLSEAAAIARSAQDQQWRNQMSAELAVRLAETGLSDRALDGIAELEDPNWRTDTLRRIGHLLKSEADIGRALQTAAFVPSGHLVRTNKTFSQRGKQIAQTKSSLQAAAIAPLTARVKADLKLTLHELWKQTLRQMGEERTELLLSMRDLNLIIRGLSGAGVSIDVSRAVRDVMRWWP
jgi:hypothetical protein